MKRFLNIEVRLADRQDEMCFSAKLDKLSVELPERDWGVAADRLTNELRAHIEAFQASLQPTSTTRGENGPG